MVDNVAFKMESSSCGVWGVPLGEWRGIGPSVDSCSVVMDESWNRIEYE